MRASSRGDSSMAIGCARLISRLSNGRASDTLSGRVAILRPPDWSTFSREPGGNSSVVWIYGARSLSAAVADTLLI
jgi:hypothetical protein